MLRWKRSTRVFSILALFLSALLAACGSSSTPTPSASSPATLSMWTWKTDNVPGLQAIAKDFKAKTGITVNVSAYTPDAAYRTKVTTAAQSSSLPDILSYWSGSQWDLVTNGLLQSLQGKVDSTWKSSFLPGTYDQNSVYTEATQAACKLDSTCEHGNVSLGQTVSVPYVAGQAMFVYANKNLLQQAGLSAQAPQTAEEWETMMQTVKDKTHTAGLVTGVKNPDVSNFWLFQPMLMTSCGVDTYNAIYTGKDHFTNPCAVRVLDWMYSLSTNKLWMPGVLQADIDPADQAFAQGKAAFDIGGTYTLSGLIANGMKTSDLISFPIPPLKGSIYSSLKVSPTSLIEAGITKDSKHFDQSLQFLKFLTSQPEMETFAKLNDDIPAVQVNSDPAKVGPVIASLLNSFSKDSPFATSQGQVQQLKDARTTLETGLQQFITGESTPSSLAAKVDAANQASLHK